MKPIYLILLCALILYSLSLNQSLWLDEAINVIAARDRAPLDLVSNYSLGDFHPPLYHLILHYWIKLHGHDEIAVRAPSLFFSLVSIYFTYRISRSLWHKQLVTFGSLSIPINLLAPILLTTSGLHTYYANEARMYALATACVTASFFYMLKLLPTPLFRNRRSYYRHLNSHLFLLVQKPVLSSLFILFTIASLYTDYLPWLLLPLWLLLLPIHTLISTILTIPWWPFFYLQLHTGLTAAAQYPGWNQVVGQLTLKNIILIPIKFTIGRVSIDHQSLYFLSLLFPLFIITSPIIFSLVRISRTKLTPESIIHFWLFSPLIIGIFLAVKISLLSYFRFLFVLPAFYLVINHGLIHAPKKWQSILISFLLLINFITTSAYLFNPKFHRENWRDLGLWTQSVSQHYTSSLMVIPNLAQAAPFQYYQPYFPIADSLDHVQLPDVVFLIRYVQEIFDPQDHLRKTLEASGYFLTSQQNFNGVVVWLYTRPTKTYARFQPPDVKNTI